MFVVVLTASFLAIVSAQTGLCPAPNGDFPNPSSERCTTFFRCIQGNPNLLRCPSNQRFDFLFRICRQQRLVDCNNQLQVFAAPSAAAGSGGLGNGAGTFAGSGGLGGLGALGGLAGGQLGAGLPDGGLVTLLSQLGASGGDGQNGSNSLATILLMSALMNKRNTANQQAPPPPIGGPIPFYPQNNLLPTDQVNNQIWQQPYAPDGAGITGADGRNYILLPQAQQGQTYGQGNLPAVGSGQYGSVLSSILPQVQSALQGQNSLLSQYLPQGQNVLYNNALRGIGQLQLEKMIALPSDSDAERSLNSTSTKINADNRIDSSDNNVLTTLDSESVKTNANNRINSSDIGVLKTLSSASVVQIDSNLTTSSDSGTQDTEGSTEVTVNDSKLMSSSDSNVLTNLGVSNLTINANN